MLVMKTRDFHDGAISNEAFDVFHVTVPAKSCGGENLIGAAAHEQSHCAGNAPLLVRSVMASG